MVALAAVLAATPAPPIVETAAPAHSEPVITSVWLSTKDIRAGQTVSGRVETSDNVGYVEARIDYRNLPLHHDAPGKFSVVYTVPWWLPWWLRHEWTLQIIARSVDGTEAKEQLPVIPTCRGTAQSISAHAATSTRSLAPGWASIVCGGGTVRAASRSSVL